MDSVYWKRLVRTTLPWPAVAKVSLFDIGVYWMLKTWFVQIGKSCPSITCWMIRVLVMHWVSLRNRFARKYSAFSDLMFLLVLKEHWYCRDIHSVTDSSGSFDVRNAYSFISHSHFKRLSSVVRNWHFSPHIQVLGVAPMEHPVMSRKKHFCKNMCVLLCKNSFFLIQLYPSGCTLSCSWSWRWSNPQRNPSKKTSRGSQPMQPE